MRFSRYGADAGLTLGARTARAPVVATPAPPPVFVSMTPVRAVTSVAPVKTAATASEEERNVALESYGVHLRASPLDPINPALWEQAVDGLARLMGLDPSQAMTRINVLDLALAHSPRISSAIETAWGTLYADQYPAWMPLPPTGPRQRPAIGREVGGDNQQGLYSSEEAYYAPSSASPSSWSRYLPWVGVGVAGLVVVGLFVARR